MSFYISVTETWETTVKMNEEGLEVEERDEEAETGVREEDTEFKERILLLEDVSGCLDFQSTRRRSI
jgi:hypothetical protein